MITWIISRSISSPRDLSNGTDSGHNRRGSLLAHTDENAYEFSAVSGKLLTLPGTLNGYEAFHAMNENVTSQAYHCHDYYELYIHVQGGQYFGLDNDLYLLEPNEMIILPPFSMHGIIFEKPAATYERAYLNLSPETLQILGCDQIDLNSYFQSYAAEGRIMIHLTQDEADRCLSVLDQLQNYVGSDDPVERYAHYALILNFLSTVCYALRRTAATASPITSNNVIQDVLSYINHHYTESLKISDLAKRFNISDSFLAHRFAKFTNRSVYDYILYRRIMLAKEIINSDATLNTIAYQCGFNDYSNFLRMFTKIVGKSPAEYRKSLRARE